MAITLKQINSASRLVDSGGKGTEYFLEFLKDIWRRTGETGGLGALASQDTIDASFIPNDTITYAKIQNVSATNRILGRQSSGAGDVEEIICTAAGRALLDDADASTQRATLGLGTIATQNANNITITGGTAALASGSVVAGSSVSNATVGGSLNTNTTSASNVGVGETDLITYTLPANALSTNGQSIEVLAWGTYAANANNKTVKIYFGATAVLDTGIVAANGGSWAIQMRIIRTGAATQIAMASFLSDNTTTVKLVKTASPTATLSGAVTIKVTGTGSADADITQLAMQTTWRS